MKEESRKTILKFLRWIAVLPASLIGSILIFLIFLLIGDLLGEHRTGILLQINLWTANFVAGFTYISIGTYMAPKQRKITMGVLYGLLVVFLIFGIVYNIMTNNWKYLINGICTLLGCTAALIYLIKEGDIEE